MENAMLDPRPLVGRLRWIRQYPAYGEAPARAALRTIGFTLREQMAGAEGMEFEACGGRRFRSPRNNISSFIAAIFEQRDLNIVRFWQRRLKPGAVFFDVGANIGLYAVPASQQVGPDGRVICFEAHPAIHAYLRRNLARNTGGNAVAENLAVGSRSGETRITFNAGNPGENHVARGGEAGETVRIVALDDYCAGAGIGRVDYMKIDVEGYEINVLRGAERLVAASPEILIQTEYEPVHLSRYGAPSELGDLLAGWGFRPYRIAWRDGAAIPLDSLAGYTGEIVWSRRDLAAPQAS